MMKLAIAIDFTVGTKVVIDFNNAITYTIFIQKVQAKY